VPEPEIDPVPPPAELPARFCRRPFPPYRFVPGRCPHPHRDPEGHGVGVAPDTPAAEAWRYGVDLFNARFYWEAHEAWEAVWRATSRGSTAYLATKGMIQIAASFLTLHMRRVEASRRLALRGAELLERARAGSGRYRQVDLAAVARLARARMVQPAGVPRLEDAAFLVELDA
jgi:uncharacterized protein